MTQIFEMESEKPTKCEQKMWHAMSLPYMLFTKEKRSNFPVRFWYRLKRNYTIAKIGFASKQWNRKKWGQTPETFKLLGSHDCQNRVVLKTIFAAGFTGPNQTKSWVIPCSNQGEYLCYGIEITKVASSRPNYAQSGLRVWNRVSITDLKMYY